MAMTINPKIPTYMSKKLSRFGLTATTEEECYVILDTLDRNKVLLYTKDIEDVLHLISDRADELHTTCKMR